MIEHFCQSIQIILPQTYTIELIFKIFFYLSISISVIYYIKKKSNGNSDNLRVNSIMKLSIFIRMLDNSITELSEIKEKLTLDHKMPQSMFLSNDDREKIKNVIKYLNLLLTTVIEE